jgi:hypothetical protein
LPIAAFLELERHGRAPFRRDQVLLCTGKGASWNTVPALIRMDEDFARLVGYYLSEGCLTEDNSLRIRFRFGAHEDDLISDTLGILESLGVRSSVHRLKRWQTVHIKVSSRLLGTLFRDVLKCGLGSFDAQVPPQLMNAPASVRRNLLAGLLRGDGDVRLTPPQRTYEKDGRSYRHRWNAATVGYFTSSPVLLQQVTLLLQGLGPVPTFRRRKPHGPVATVEVAGIESAPPQPVYSMEVKDTGTFVTSYGIAVHNCIPVDPLYLSWKLKTLNYRARFIELAGEINSAMPEYVCDRVAWALNERQRSVKGSRVLVLGVSYKRDVDDVRESPALDILKILESRGARVGYNDPHVPELQLNGTTLRSEELMAGVRSADVTVIVTDHTCYPYAEIVQNANVVVDTRNATKGIASEKILKI